MITFVGNDGARRPLLKKKKKKLRFQKKLNFRKKIERKNSRRSGRKEKGGMESPISSVRKPLRVGPQSPVRLINSHQLLQIEIINFPLSSSLPLRWLFSSVKSSSSPSRWPLITIDEAVSVPAVRAVDAYTYFILYFKVEPKEKEKRRYEWVAFHGFIERSEGLKKL